MLSGEVTKSRTLPVGRGSGKSERCVLGGAVRDEA